MAKLRGIKSDSVVKGARLSPLGVDEDLGQADVKEEDIMETGEKAGIEDIPKVVEAQSARDKGKGMMKGLIRQLKKSTYVHLTKNYLRA